MNDISLIKQISSLNKKIFTISDLEKILLVKSSGLRTVISRLTKKGVLIQAARGIYSVFGIQVSPEEAAIQIYPFSYLSLKTVLSRVGWINQIPRTLQFVTSQKTHQATIFGISAVFHQIKRELFFGYEIKNGIAIAYPEKALLDLLYFTSRGRENISFAELSLTDFNFSRWKKFKRQFPLDIKNLTIQVEKVLSYNSNYV